MRQVLDDLPSYIFAFTVWQGQRSQTFYVFAIIIRSMIFNSHPTIANLLESSYSTGNCLFSEDIIYSPVGNSVKKIDLRSNKTQLLPFQNPHTNALILVSPNGITMMAIDYAGHATIFNLQGNFVVGEFNFKTPVRTAVFSPNGNLLGIGQDKGFAVYECSCLYRCFQPLVLLKKYKTRHSGNICWIQFSKDNRFLLTCGEDNIIFVNNLFPIQDYIPITLEAHRYNITAASFSHDMKYLYSFDAGSNLFVWKWIEQTTEAYDNLKASKKRARDNVRGHLSEKKEQNQDCFSDFERNINNGRFILAQKLSLNQGGFLKRVVFKSHMGFLACTHTNGKFSIWRLIGEELEQVQNFSVGDHKISTLAVNQSCTWLALGIKSLGQLIVWEWKSQSYILNQKGFIHQTREIAYNSANMYATGTSEGTIRLWDPVSSFCVATLAEHQAAITGLKFSNINTLFSSSLDGTVNAYDINKQKKFRVFRPDANCQLVCLELDTNGEAVFAGAFDPYEVYSWNVQTGHLLQIITGHEGPLACLAFVKDNLVSASWDHTVKIHAIFARQLNVQTLEHGSEVTAIAVHPSETQFAVATMNGEIYLWQPQSGQMQGVLHSDMTGGRSYFSKISSQNDPSNKYLRALAYSPCGNYLYGGGKSKYIYVFDINHRMLLTKISLTQNKDIQGVIQKLNSKYVKNGVPTYELEVQAQNEVYSDDEKKEAKLPGSKKIDISEIRLKLEAEVKKIIVKNNQQLIITTSFGTLILSTAGHKSVFNPYQLSPSITPQMIPEFLRNKDYTSAVLVTLKLNVDIRKLIRKIPGQYVKAIIGELQPKYAELLLEKICEEGKVSLREVLWVESILKHGYKPSTNLRGALECLEDQVKLMSQVQGSLDMVQIIGIDDE